MSKAFLRILFFTKLIAIYISNKKCFIHFAIQKLCALVDSDQQKIASGSHFRNIKSINVILTRFRLWKIAETYACS